MSQLAITHYHQPLSRLSEAQQLVARHEIQALLQSISLSSSTVVLADAVSSAIPLLREKIVQKLLQNNPETDCSNARSLSPQDAVKVADFLIYSAIATVGSSAT